jgi:Fe-S cluster biogenesis protein NfuA
MTIIPVNVYAESTPNPAAMKFVSSVMLMPDGSVEFGNAAECGSSPLARQLFSFSGVKGVFISSNFITVTKEGDIDWYEITGIIREFIRGYLMSGEKVFTSDPFKDRKDPQAIAAEVVNAPAGSNGDQTHVESEIIKLLEEYVRPAVEQDGGAIHFRSFQDGVVTVALKGSCSGCPSSTLTLKSGIENLLKRMLPEVTEVVAEAE